MDKELKKFQGKKLTGILLKLQVAISRDIHEAIEEIKVELNKIPEGGTE